MIRAASATFSFSTFPLDGSQSHPNPAIYRREFGYFGMLEVSIPPPKGWIDLRDACFHSTTVTTFRPFLDLGSQLLLTLGTDQSKQSSATLASLEAITQII